MTHVTRWRTITATASTAVLAAGAFGIAAAVESPVQGDPEAIEVAAEAEVSDPVDDSDLGVSVASSASQVSEESAEEAGSGSAAGQDAAATELQSDDTAAISAADVTSAPDEDSVSPTFSAEDSVSPSPDDEEEDSVSVEEEDQSIAPAGDEGSPSPDEDDDSPSVDDDDEDSLDSAS